MCRTRPFARPWGRRVRGWVVGLEEEAEEVYVHLRQDRVLFLLRAGDLRPATAHLGRLFGFLWLS